MSKLFFFILMFLIMMGSQALCEYVFDVFGRDSLLFLWLITMFAGALSYNLAEHS